MGLVCSPFFLIRSSAKLDWLHGIGPDRMGLCGIIDGRRGRFFLTLVGFLHSPSILWKRSADGDLS